MTSTDIQFKEPQFSVEDSSPSFSHLLPSTQDSFSFSSQDSFDKLKENLDSSNCEGITEQQVTKGRNSLKGGERQRKDSGRGKENEEEETELNAFMTAFLALAMVCPDIDVTKLLGEKKGGEAKKDFQFAPKKRKCPKQLSKTPANLNKRSYDKSIRNSKTCRL